MRKLDPEYPLWGNFSAEYLNALKQNGEDVQGLLYWVRVHPSEAISDCAEFVYSTVLFADYDWPLNLEKLRDEERNASDIALRS